MTLRARIPLSLLATATAAALALSACSTSGDEDTAAPASGPPSSSAPGPLTIATSFAIDDLDPLENGFWGPEFGYVELLMQPERSGTPSPWVLKSLTSVDPTTWTLELNEGIEFESGRALDGAALAELLTYVDAENEGFAADGQLASATATGPLTVTVKTDEPVPGLANVLADESNVPVFDVAAYKRHLASGAGAGALLTAGLYTGPYVMRSLTSERAELTPDTDYWGGTPGLSSLTIRFVPEPTARAQAVQAGEADLALYMPTSTARTLQGRDDAFYVTGQPTGSTFAFQLNHARAPFEDPLVRRAVYAAVDYRALAEDVLSGLAGQAKSVFGPTVPYAVETQETDLDQARSLLEQAGWTGSGTRTKAGEQLSLTLLNYAQQPDSVTLSVALQAQLREVGIDVQVKQVPDITEAREGRDWDGAIVGDSLFSFALSPVDGLRNDLRSGAEENYSRVSSAALDTVVDQLGSEFDEGRRDALLRQAQAIIHDNGLWAATVLRLPSVVTNATWKGYQPPISNLWVTATTAP